jgi:tRNA(Ile)-lysidine synthase
MSILARVRRTIGRHGLIPPDSRVAVALSGGADSVALVHVLREIASDEGFQLVGVAHLNHRLRGADADADEQFCRDCASALDLPIEVEHVDVAQLARAQDLSIEQAAHDARYEFFNRAAARLNATVVAVAHTKDDQAETFLLRLLRGAGPRGLSGMHPRSGIAVRPFIETSRADVRAFVDERHLEFRHDGSNDDIGIPRNRIRHELLPLLERSYTSGIVDVLDRAATVAREDADYLEGAAVAAAARLITPTTQGVEINAHGLLREPPAIARRVIRLAQQSCAGDRFIGFDAVEAVFGFAVSNSKGQLDLPGHRVNRRGSNIVLTRSRGREKPVPATEFSYRLEVPGQVLVPEAGCAISAATDVVPAGRRAADLWRLAARADETVIDAGRLSAPLAVRNRRAGDSFRPLGLRGRKKLQDLFVDAKIDRFEREITPVIVDSTGCIVWVAGHTLAEDFKVTETTRDVVILKRVPI